ncbi:MAG: polymer-forming cytoskeletal protein [Hyphomicrobiaceae bacterium]
MTGDGAARSRGSNVWGEVVASNPGNMIVGADAVVTASIRNCRRLDVYGYVDGDVIADAVIVHKDGQVFGRVRAGEAEVLGRVQGDVTVKNLIAIRSTGTVTGNVRYGRMTLEAGGELSAEVRNVPPRLVGDFAVQVPRGGSVTVTTLDIAAVDPDNAAEDLVFTVSNATGGHLAHTDAKSSRVDTFTLADLAQNRICFVHDGSAASVGSFDVVVTDAEGATSGAPRKVDVTVIAPG